MEGGRQGGMECVNGDNHRELEARMGSQLVAVMAATGIQDTPGQPRHYGLDVTRLTWSHWTGSRCGLRVPPGGSRPMASYFSTQWLPTWLGSDPAAHPQVEHSLCTQHSPPAP